MKDRILQAYKDNHAELLEMARYGDFEEETYCKGYEEALNFVLSLLETEEGYRTARLVECTDYDTTYGTLHFKNATADEVQDEIYNLKRKRHEIGDDGWCIADIIEDLPSEWGCYLTERDELIEI
jgi:hypothetical protein